jgi:hypothetical protein
MLEKLQKISLDHLGVSTSVLCAFHCAAIPVLFSVGLVNTAHLSHNHVFDIIIVGVGLFIACFSLFKDFKKHKSILPLLLALVGFLALGVAVLSHELPVLVNVFGGLLVASAHLWNIRLYSSCKIMA